MGLVEEDLDGFGRLRFLAFISRWKSIALTREQQMALKTRVPALAGGPGGERGRRRMQNRTGPTAAAWLRLLPRRLRL